jgi:REP element-mobilizing transposase RayT
MNRHRQLELRLPTWGGARANSGRKPKGEKAGVSHLRRPHLSTAHPVHTTLRVAKGCWNLRSRRALLALQGAFESGRDRFGFRLVHYSIQGNHLHLIVEAEGKESLARGMKGLEVRMARALNRMMQRRGSVFADRYHAHVLRTPREVAHAIRYVLGNHAHHAEARGERVGFRVADRFSSAIFLAAELPDEAPVATPATWLLRVGWLRAPMPQHSSQLSGLRRQ